MSSTLSIAYPFPSLSDRLRNDSARSLRRGAASGTTSPASLYVTVAPQRHSTATPLVLDEWDDTPWRTIQVVVVRPQRRHRALGSAHTSTFQPFALLPLEVVERILAFVPLRDLVRFKRIDKSFQALLAFPLLYPSVALSSPLIPSTLRTLLPDILPGTQSLALPSFPLASLANLLPCLSTRLTILDLSFSGVTDSLLQSLDWGVIEGVRELKLKGCRGIKDGRALAQILQRAESVDLSWSGVWTLPSPTSPISPTAPSFTSTSSSSSSDGDDGAFSDPLSDDSGFFDTTPSLSSSETPTEAQPWPSLLRLSLSSCPFLATSSDAFVEFLASLPTDLRSLDLSHLRVPEDALARLAFSDEAEDEWAGSWEGGAAGCRASRPAGVSSTSRDADVLTVNLRGNDLLTRSAVRRLGTTWEKTLVEAKRGGKRGVEVVAENDAVLESEGEEDVRRFVEMVAGNSR